MPPRQNIIGQRFGRLVVMKFAFIAKSGSAVWHCRCDCGKTRTTSARNLKVGDAVSCGCRRIEAWRENGKANGRANKTHGQSRRSSEYSSWSAMRTRCTNPNATGYDRYGGAGIKVCKRWNRFENFLADMGKRPKGKTLDRINSNGNYTPSNCRWATPLVQRLNQR